MADTDTLISDFTSGLPAFLTDASTSTGSAVVSGGVLTLTAGGGAGQSGMVITGTTHNVTSFYCRMYPLPVEPLAVAFNFLDASSDGFGFGVGTSSNTPGAAEVRVNRWAGGSLSHPASLTYSATDHRWFRMRISGANLLFETAPDSGFGPGTWTQRHSIAYGTDLAAWNPAASTLYLYNDPNTVDAQGNVATIDGINTNTEAGSAPWWGGSLSNNWNRLVRG